MPLSIEAPTGYLLERLDTDIHKRDGFSCGNAALDSFLLAQANQAQVKDLSSTYVLIEDPGHDRANPCQVVGFITFVGREIPLIDCPEWVSKKTNKAAIPAIFIGRMAVDTRHKGKRLGEFLLVNVALTAAKEQNEISGCFAVFLEAKDDVAKNFYLKYGFMELPRDRFTLFMPMSEIRKLFSN